ncbi:tyrosine-protein phosphatase [uncultured Lactobacillus sp.]|uniref:tyrosine-protein phosphatase n=1 Tax=uncultured Lactobacillus sp. TaxID=153152 RepID=UPI00262604B3|nr:tyrosine-protein phosphatase [uncultured Lactobacillus sp.]
MTHQRLITLDGTVNFRDIGGYENNHGQKVRWNKIYRSDSLSSLTPEDQEKLEQMKITVDCDLRSSNEQDMAPDRLWKNAQFVDCHVYSEDRSGNFVDEKRPLYKFFHHIPEMDSYLGQIYQDVILSPASQRAFSRVFAELLTLPQDQALVYHCSAGKDRTGMMSALILTGLGVDDRTIAKDYLLTNELYSFGLKKQMPSDSEMLQMVNQMNVTQGEGTAIKGVTATINEGFGSFENYFTKILGFTKQDLVDLKKLYLI